MLSHLFTGVLALQLCAVVVQSVEKSKDLRDCMQLKHEIIVAEYGQRRNSIECRVDKCDAFDSGLWKSLDSIKISRKTYGDDQMAILDKKQSYNPATLPALPEKADLFGYTNNKLYGFLRIEWSHPSEDQKMETYSCSMTVTNDYMQIKTVSISIDVDLNAPTYTELQEKVTSMEGDLKRCNETTEDLYKRIGDQTNDTPSCNEEYKDKLVEMFFVYYVDSKKYYLSKSNYYEDVESAKICSIVGGYLAEINNEEELGDVLAFLKKSSALGALVGGKYIGGKYTGTIGQWTYQRNDQPVEFLKWKENRPDNPDKKNCIGLWHEYENAMKNLPCDDNVYSLPFLCEVDHYQS